LCRDGVGDYLLKFIDSKDEMGYNFWEKLDSYWKTLDESFHGHPKYAKFYTHIQEFYYCCYYSQEAGNREELGIESTEEWHNLKERALFNYRDKYGKDAIIFVP
jgi:hypothetical protein